MATVPTPGTPGNDTIVPGTGGDTLYGDPFVGVALGTGHGGNDILTATGDGNRLVGDASSMDGTGRGGNDSLHATGASNDLYGDAEGLLSGNGRGGNDTLSATGGGNDLYGDAGIDIFDNARGGNDTLSASGNQNRLFGDAGRELRSPGRGGNDTLSASGNENRLFGDADTLEGSARGGNDILSVTGDFNTLYGDANFFGSGAGAVGGNDVLSATGTGNQLYGDGGFRIASNGRGGNDVLTAVSTSGQSNDLYGDARELRTDAVGGNDTLIGGNGNDLIVGDALIMNPTARGGNDQLWGDAKGAASGGADSFAFAGNFGKDVINDFRQSDGDQIQLNGYGAALTIDDVLDNVSAVGKNTVIDIGAALDGPAKVNTITLAKFTDPLTADDFIFTDVS
ncbi:MAG: calcium-binding protein [Alphaproteobacteria bacterium]